LTKYGGGVGI